MDASVAARATRERFYNAGGKMMLPIDLHVIAERMGVEVSDATLEPDVAGFLVKDSGEAGARAYINKDDWPQRQRFTLAHELGHLVRHNETHGRDAEVGLVEYRAELSSLGSDQTEIWCNAFAAELLMPEAVIYKYWAKGYTAEQLRNLFDVSKAAMANRLNNLGLV